MRRLVAIAGGAVLALALFFGLALLVAPPEALKQPEKTLAITLTEAQAPSTSEPVAQSQASLPPPPAPTAPPRPVAAPQPVPDVQSQVALAKSEAPPPEKPAVNLDAHLPDLSVARPSPQPRRPQPQPKPRPAPTPVPSAQSSAAQDSSSPQRTASRRQAAASAAQTAQDLTSAQQQGLIRPVKLHKPEYPRRARLRGTEGFVEVQFVIQTNGRVDRSSIKVVDSQPGSVFDDAATDAVSSWVFAAIDKPVHIIQRLEFKLRG